MNRTIDLPKQLRGAEVRAASFDEAENTIDVVWTTGATVRRRSWFDGPYDEELVVEPGAVRLERLNAGAPLLDTHSDWSLKDVIGSVVPGTARLARGEGLAMVKLSRAPSFADIVQNIRDGIIRNISVGYIIHRVEKIEADDGSVPVWRVVDWEPIEVSAVPVPADPGAQIRSVSGARTFPCELISAGGPVRSASFQLSVQDGPGWFAPLRRES
jgi:HK97 family phage prohead protease